MIHYQKKSLLNHFGLSSRGTYRGLIHEKFIESIKDGIYDNQLMAIVGRYGQGKSTIAELVSYDINQSNQSGVETVKFVYINSQNLEKLNVSGVLNAIVWDVSNESPKNNAEAKARQAARILGQRYVDSLKKKRTCIVIENAHRMHHSTLMQLKDFWETKFMGVSPLLSILLIGHPELTEKLARRKEVFWRFQLLDMEKEEKWMCFDEKVNYLSAVFGHAIDSEARAFIAGKAEGPLHMEILVRETMETAKLIGKHVVDAECVPQTLKEKMSALGVSLAQLGEAAGLPKSTVDDVVNGRSKTIDNIDKVNAALQEMMARRTKKMEVVG